MPRRDRAHELCAERDRLESAKESGKTPLLTGSGAPPARPADPHAALGSWTVGTLVIVLNILRPLSPFLSSAFLRRLNMLPTPSGLTSCRSHEGP